MIFVTVGTHEQQFDRLVAAVDRIKGEKPQIGEVVIQTGYSGYKPEHCRWKNFYSYQEMVDYTKKAGIVITHGGPSSFMLPIKMGKVPIVVPRQKKYGEHVNDHQLNFCRKIRSRCGILLVEDTALLDDLIVNYDSRTSGVMPEPENHTQQFVDQLQRIIDELMGF
ncbi:MAG: multidrug MFS transporter [Lachnospiraceae bacterium]|nr:multidrug MFS transporter [Lachnospiraceae bacterium]